MASTGFKEVLELKLHSSGHGGIVDALGGVTFDTLSGTSGRVIAPTSLPNLMPASFRPSVSEQAAQ